MSRVSVVCTSFNRPDLLEITLRSFHAFNTYPIESFVVIDDSEVIGCNDHLREIYPNVTFTYNKKRLGQIISVDKAYLMVSTPYIFHMEEDWQFYKSGFIEDSFKVLSDNATTQVVWLRSEKDTNGHQFNPQVKNVEGVNYSILNYNHAGWHGFTFNPSLRRLDTWEGHNGYRSIATFIPKLPWVSEQQIGNYYKQKGYTAAIIRGKGYVKHIGDNRGIRK